MKQCVDDIVGKATLTRDDLIFLLGLTGKDQKDLFKWAERVKEANVGNKVYFRGLVEFSNICAKNCLYCGIRKDNTNTERYNLSDEDIIEAAKFAHEQNYASLVLQAGELSSPAYTNRIENLLQRIHQQTQGELRITLSLGEQSEDVFKRWMKAGAMRYLLRIESSGKELYEKYHPKNEVHSYDKRLEALQTLKSLGYQTGTGVMIGLPGQTLEDLADDLLFMKSFGIDMVGMGPFIEHKDTPMHEATNQWPLHVRFDMALKMIACLRILMPKINIAAATALQAIDKMGREKAIKVGANVIMPNITPGVFRDSYKLYDNKPCTDENADDCTNCLQARVGMTGNDIAFGEWGDSRHYTQRTNSI